jgi:hypothetical protein
MPMDVAWSFFDLRAALAQVSGAEIGLQIRRHISTPASGAKPTCDAHHGANPKNAPLGADIAQSADIPWD